MFVLGLSESEANAFQADLDTISGQVTFRTSDNIYLKFPDTDLIQKGDTVYVESEGSLKPCLIIFQKSSVSVISKSLGCKLNVGDPVFVFSKRAVVETEKEPVKEKVLIEDSPPLQQKSVAKKKETDGIRGSLSINNYSTISESDFYSRSVGRLSLSTKPLDGNKLSFRTLARFRQNRIRSGENQSFGKLYLYEFAADYQLNQSIKVTGGRFINPKMLSVGAIDGLKVQYEGKSGFTGVIAGTRPDPYSYGFNANLLQVGVYGGMYHGASKYAFSNIGFIEQINGGRTDRRYLYVQHQSSLSKTLNLFVSSELDLYQKDTMGLGQMKSRLTNLYFSLNYRPVTALSLMASYDVRRNFILYESFEEELDRLLRDDPYRTGLRLRASYRINKKIRIGVSGSQRVQSDHKNEFSNVTGFLNFSKMPGISGRAQFMVAENKNSFLKYRSILARYTRDLMDNRLTVSPYFRYINYDYFSRENNNAINQIYAGLDTGLDIAKKTNLRLLYDISLRENIITHRFNINITNRF
jgi:hypothetical protein